MKKLLNKKKKKKLTLVSNIEIQFLDDLEIVFSQNRIKKMNEIRQEILAFSANSLQIFRDLIIILVTNSQSTTTKTTTTNNFSS